MVDFPELQRRVRERLVLDRGVRVVETEGVSFEAAAAEASTLLDIPRRRLDFEVVERGSAGFLGAGKKTWRIKAYERAEGRKAAAAAAQVEAAAAEAGAVIEDSDGQIFVHLGFDGAFIKVLPAKGHGKKPDEKDARRRLLLRSVTRIDEAAFTEALKREAGEYVKVGDFDPRPGNNSTPHLDITGDDMRAFLSVTQPGPGGTDLSYDDIITYLRNNYVTCGIKEDAIREFVDNPVYREKVLVAEAVPPVDGTNAYIEYNFETDQTKVKLKEDEKGNVDFKELNVIQNVLQNQPLAKKMPCKQGVPGKTVTGKLIPAKEGKDIPMPDGKNVHLNEAGDTIIADINGQVLLVGAKINVEPILELDTVGADTGNIIFLGTVVVKGNVDDNFSIKADGNIEVNGNVGKSNLDAEGDIIVHQGINAKNGGFVRTSRSVWAKFIENANIEAGIMVSATDEIMSSKVDASKRIICQGGKKSHIVGGHLRATEEINAKVLGNSIGRETICEVGIDPKMKNQIEQLKQSKIETEKQLEEMQHTLKTLMNIKRQRKVLPDDKEAQLTEVNEKVIEVAAELRRITEEVDKLQLTIENLTIRGKVSASDRVCSGVKVIIKDTLNEIHSDYKSVTFVLENKLVRAIKYEEPEDDAKKGPDGRTAD
ncbi:MAG: FapA family protein [Treponema sp.]|jgi:uncharacterized protein (DUF342 family)|nr:FapA family protein [Treponema sp.]